MYSCNIIAEGSKEELREFLRSLGTAHTPLLPRRVLLPPSGKEIAKAYRKEKTGPANLLQWKKRYWGTEKIENPQIAWSGEERVTLSFLSPASPEPLVREISKSPLVRGALLRGPGELSFIGESDWTGPENVFWHTEELRELGLLDSLQAKIRTTAYVPELEKLRQGHSVRAHIFNRWMSLQRDLLGNSHADFILDDTAPLDDVLVAWRGDLCLLLDLEK